MSRFFCAAIFTCLCLAAATTGAVADGRDDPPDGKDRNKSAPLIVDVEAWWRAEVASATPVSDNYPFYRSGELVGVEVRNPANALLGGVADVIQSPRTGKIAYLIIDRGPIFGFGFGVGDKRVAVPWANFRETPTASLLILDATQATLDHAPLGYDRYARTAAAAALQSQKIDAYWTVQ